MSPAVAAWARAGAVVAGVVALDQVAKAIAIASFARGESENVFLGLDLTHVRNTGIAFGALEDGGGLILALVGVAVGLLLVYFARHAATPLLWLPVGTIVGGALGNLADRARDGTVIDFIDPIAWPAFNIADVAVVAGVLGLLYVMDPGPSARRSGSRPA